MTSRKMRRAAEQRAKAARRLETRPDRRTKPQRDAEAKAERQAKWNEHREWLASLTPEQRERYNRREDERMERMMGICAPALLGAMALATRG